MASSKPPTVPAADLPALLIDLGFRGLSSQLDDFVARATRARLGPVQLVEEITRIEKQDRARRSLERRTARSRIGSFKPMPDFDWAWPKRLDREQVERALALRFLAEGANLILVGAHGLGKTMILKNVAHRAIEEGHTVIFTTAAKFLNDLNAQDSPRTLERRMKHYAGVALLCIDELGYLSYDSRAADLLFEITSRRYANARPIALSTNLAFADWNQVFPHATCTVALIDRLTHKADIIPFEGKSWRRKEAGERNPKSGP